MMSVAQINALSPAPLTEMNHSAGIIRHLVDQSIVIVLSIIILIS
jgi:hypothetical protein